MSHHSIHGNAHNPPGSDRRAAPRLSPEAVPSIAGVRTSLGETARLIDISKTGVLIETKARLLPGRRSTLVLSGPNNESQRMDGKVVRTQLISIAGSDSPLYLTALNFTTELELEVPAGAAHNNDARSTDVVSRDLAERTGSQPRLDGPFDALWATETGSDLVAVSNITETGCFVEIQMPVALGDVVSISVLFSDVHHLSLTGTVASVTPNLGCTVRFASLTSELRRALKVENLAGVAAERGNASSQAMSPLDTAQVGMLFVESSTALPPYLPALSANDW